jgi:hypothetical protein
VQQFQFILGISHRLTAAPTASAAAASTASAAAQITANWEAFFGGTTPAAKKIALLQNGQKYAVLPERSGMAASAANTSREIGAVTGVAVLGSLVISQLHASLTAQLNHLGIPAQFQTLVINAIETGQIPQNTSAYAGYGKIVQEVIAAAYTAFHSGLHAALYLAAGLVLAAGLLALITLRSPAAPAEVVTFPVTPSDRGSGQPRGGVRRK